MIVVLLILAMIQGGGVAAQSLSSSEYFNLYLESPNQTASDAFAKFARKLEVKSDRLTEEEFLKHVFDKTHFYYLKFYEEYASFDQLADEQIYNCLTGTALYALLLNYLEFDFKIIETNYHIFLLVNTSSGSQVIFEATDPINGFISGKDELAKRIAHYQEDNMRQAKAGKSYYYFDFKLYNEVNLDQMLGLLHYNKAIEAFNEHYLTKAVDHLDKAIRRYNSPRIQEFSKLILLTVVQSKLDMSVKVNCVKTIQSIRRQRIPGIANRD